jgi:beta-N-acetylhexosaminidase
LRWFCWIALLAVLLQPLRSAQASPDSQTSDANQKAKSVLSRMTPDEKVGQLFLVTFKNRDISPNSQIYDLIVNHHIGGVMLSAANDNFTGPDNTVREAYNLISVLQARAWEGSQKVFTDSKTKTSYTPEYIPLFVGMSQEGDGIPYDQILNGMTPLPDEMAIGATWDQDIAEQGGEVLGQELRAIGVNLLLGPSLDVLEVTQTEGAEDYGSRTFGGDPFWVGEMGKSFIAGLHKGSVNRVAVIAKNFPGRGSSDRPPDEEVSTVRKTLDQLKLIELLPFFKVTGKATSPVETTDGLLVTHIRYPFQGNIRATTRPVSLDQAALDQLLTLPELASWRSNGGVMVSDNLGSPAVKKFYSPTGEVFDARQVARDAFLAGNDLLYLGDITTSGDPDSYTSITKILDFFGQKYREDPAFAQRVDLSVERLLTLKFKVYGQFLYDAVQNSETGLTGIGRKQDVTFKIAQESATLLSPDSAELVTALPRPPGNQDRIVFITDEITGRQCSTCPIESVFSVDAFQKSVLKLYGPDSGGQVQRYNLKSYSYLNLSQLLSGQPTTDTDIKKMDDDLRAADWIVFAAATLSNDRPESWALRKLLTDRTDLLRNKKVVVFAFNAPYFLDATDISKLTAYYAIYSKSQPFIDLAARILFQESTAAGALPVSVPGVGYDLVTATTPDPKQVISLALDMEALTPPQQKATVTATPLTATPTAVPTFKVGDSIPIRTGVILDHNHNPVPDGTVVRFNFLTGNETGSSAQQVETVTTQGVAHTVFRIQNPGLLEISVSSDPARTSEILKLDVSRGASSAITEIAPTVLPTETQTPTVTVTNTEIPPTSTPTPPPPVATVGPGSWFFAMAVIWGIAVIIFWVIRRRLNLRWGVRWALLVAFGGQFAYILFLFFHPAPKVGASLVKDLIVLGLIVLLGSLVGGLGGWIWRKRIDPGSVPRVPKKTAIR